MSRGNPLVIRFGLVAGLLHFVRNEKQTVIARE